MLRPGQSNVLIRASYNEVSNVGTIEVGSYSTQGPNTCGKTHIIHILVLIHSPHYTWRLPLFDQLSISKAFHQWPLKKEVWEVSNLKFVLLTFILLLSATEVQYKVLAFYSLRS